MPSDLLSRSVVVAGVLRALRSLLIVRRMLLGYLAALARKCNHYTRRATMNPMTSRELLKALHGVQRNLLRIEQILDLALTEETHMAVDPKIAALITQFDAATDRIAARIQKLIDAGGLSPESQAALQAEVDKLNLLGQDADNPVPTNV